VVPAPLEATVREATESGRSGESLGAVPRGARLALWPRVAGAVAMTNMWSGLSGCGRMYVLTFLRRCASIDTGREVVE
jgi:hypothetical protein